MLTDKAQAIGRGIGDIGWPGAMACEEGCDRVHSVTDPVTGPISYTYGLTVDRQSMTLPGGGVWTYAYGTDDDGWPAFDYIPKDYFDSLTLRLTSITGDMVRRGEFNSDSNGHIQSVCINETFSTGAILRW